MRDFSWKYFTMTGDVDAYLLYKQVGNREADQADEDEEESVDESNELMM